MTGRWLAALTGLALASGCAGRPTVWVFTAPWDARSDSALVAGVAPRAMMVTGWLALDSLGGAPIPLFDDPVRADSRRSGTRYLLVTSYLGDRFHPEAVRQLAADPAAARRAADEVARMVLEGRYTGVVLDLEALAPADSSALVTVVAALGGGARAGGATTVALAVPALDTLPFPAGALLAQVDRLMVMLYDQHWSGSAPGPVAERGWAREALARWVRAAGAPRVVAALPAYGYLWRDSTPTEVWGWRDMQGAAMRAGVAPEGTAGAAGVRLRLPDGGEGWLADAPLVRGMARDAAALGVRTVALWRLGLEDPAVWAALGAR